MNFQIPQFIEEKPKIVGPFTLIEFFYLLIPGIISFISFYQFNTFLWIVITVIFGAIGITLAFIPINGQPAPAVIMSGLKYLWQPHIYIWKRVSKEAVLNIKDIEKVRNNISFQDKLKSLSVSIMTNNPFSVNIKASPEEEEKTEKFQVVTYLTGEQDLAKKVDY